MLFVHSKNLLSVDNIITIYGDLLLIAYFTGISSSWPVTQVQNYPWWVIMEWDDTMSDNNTTPEESQQYLQKDVLEPLYGLLCLNHIFQSWFNRSVVWPLISNHIKWKVFFSHTVHGSIFELKNVISLIFNTILELSSVKLWLPW